MTVNTFKTILVPIDFSPCSERALHEAVTLANASKGTIYLLHVVHSFAQEDLPPFVDPAAIYKIEEGDMLALAKEHMDKLLKDGKITPQNIKQETVVRTGKPGPQVVKVADEIHADLIIMGTVGRSGLEKLIAGSTAEYVVRNAHCPVLTMKENTPTFEVKEKS